MGYYEIVVASHIDRKRAGDFAEMSLRQLPDGKTLFFGNLKDQAELFAILARIRDMNLTLLSVKKDQKEMEA